MAEKLPKDTFPQNSGPDDFQCFGPSATRDGEFESARICDLGCFTQDGKDSNKYYHGAVVQHKQTKQWYAYFEGGRTGAKKPSFQFVECASEAEAVAEFAEQLHSKNDRRGRWVTIAGIRTLQAKPGKDCYLVRPMATRSTGLPDARSIKLNEGAKPRKGDDGEGNGDSATEEAVATETGKAGKKVVKKKSRPRVDEQTLALMRDLSLATIAYTRGSMADASLPTQAAIDEARQFQAEDRPDLSNSEARRYTDTNTRLLFHGTRSVNVSGILRESLRLPKQLVGVVITGAMFGPGIYFADDWKKSAGYTSLAGSYWSGGAGGVKGRDAFMFAVDVVLGEPFVAPHAHGYTSPPKGHHSIFGKAGTSGVENNEFIIFQREQHLLRYLIEFTTT